MLKCLTRCCAAALAAFSLFFAAPISALCDTGVDSMLENSYKSGYLQTGKQANLRKLPNKKSTMLDQLKGRTLVEVLDVTEDGWAYVRVAKTGRKGYIMAELLEPEFREGIHISGIADPAIWDRSRGMSVEEQIRKVFSGVSFRQGDNTRLPGKMQMHERLKFDEDGKPMMYVFNTCSDFIRTIPSLVYDSHKPEDINTEGEDHIYDETRYFLMSRPIAPRPVVKAPPKKWNPLE